MELKFEVNVKKRNQILFFSKISLYINRCKSDHLIQNICYFKKKFFVDLVPFPSTPPNFELINFFICYRLLMHNFIKMIKFMPKVFNILPFCSFSSFKKMFNLKFFQYFSLS